MINLSFYQISSLSLLIFLVLKPTLSSINIATPVFLWLFSMVCIFFIFCPKTHLCFDCYAVSSIDIIYLCLVFYLFWQFLLLIAIFRLLTFDATEVIGFNSTVLAPPAPSYLFFVLSLFLIAFRFDRVFLGFNFISHTDLLAYLLGIFYNAKFLQWHKKRPQCLETYILPSELSTLPKVREFKAEEKYNT